MADFDSSLPVRTETAGDVEVKIVDSTVTSQKLTVNADGSINITDNAGSLTVDAVDLDIRDLTHVSDSVKVGDGTDFLAVNADGSVNITDNGGSITVDGTVTANQGTSPWVVGDGGGSLTVDAVDLDIRDIDATQDNIAISDGTDTLAINADGSVNITDNGGSLTVDAVDLDIRDLTHVSDSVKVGDGTDFLAVNTDGSINVKITDATPGTQINDYDTTASVAGGASDNHDYTAAGAGFYLKQVEASGSGKMKIEVQIETGVATDAFTTRFVMFNSTSDPNMSLHLEEEILVATGVRVRVIRTNRDNQAQDVYSTICGHQV